MSTCPSSSHSSTTYSSLCTGSANGMSTGWAGPSRGSSRVGLLWLTCSFTRGLLKDLMKEKVLPQPVSQHWKYADEWFTWCTKRKCVKRLLASPGICLLHLKQINAIFPLILPQPYKEWYCVCVCVCVCVFVCVVLWGGGGEGKRGGV